MNKVGSIGTDLIKKLFEIKGISQIFIQPYELTIRKGSYFDWKDLMPKVEKVITTGKVSEEPIKNVSTKEAFKIILNNTKASINEILSNAKVCFHKLTIKAVSLLKKINKK